MGRIEPVNPDICSCLHLKQEHGGSMAGFFKRLPGARALVIKLAQERVTNPNMPKPQKFYACLLCNCKQFK